MNVNEMLAARRRKQRMARFSKSVASGDQARAARDWQNAATRYREALELNPHAAPIWVQLGHAVKAQGSYAQAEAAYRIAVAENGSDADAHLQLGHVLKLQGRYRDAADAYTAASRADPALADADRELEAMFSKSVASGDQARAARDWQNAATRYREALELNPHAARIWVQLGHAVKEQGFHAQAEAAYRRAVAENGSDADAHLQLGHVLKLQGKYRDAADAYRAASRADPALADADRELEAIKDSPSAPDAVQAMLHDLQARTDRLAEASQDLRARTDRLADASQAAALVQFRAIDGIDAKVKNALRQEFDVGLSGPSLFADALGGLWDNFGQLHAQVQGVVEGLHSRGDWPALEQRLTVVDGNIADLAARITGEAARTTGEADRFRGELDALIGSKTAAAVAEQMSAQTARRDELEDVRSRVEFIRRELLYEFRSAVLDTGQPKAPPVTSKVLNATKVVQALGSGMLRLNIGCGHVSEDQYVNVDVRELPGVDVIADVTDLPFDDEAASEIYSAHLLEHFPEEILRRVVLPHWRKKLRAGGLLRTIVPDAGAMIKDYLDGEMPFQDLRDVTFGGQDYGGDFHFTMFTCDHIRNLLHDLGFEELIVTAQGRKNGTCRELEIVGVRGK